MKRGCVISCLISLSAGDLVKKKGLFLLSGGIKPLFSHGLHPHYAEGH